MDLDRDARRILDLATDARAPAAEDKARIEKKLAAVLGAGALATVTATTATTTQAAHAATSAGSTGAGVASSAAPKWWMGATVIAASITGYVMLATPKTAPTPTPAAPAPLVAPPTKPAAPPLAAPAPEPVPAPAPAPVRSHARKKQPAATLDEELELLHRAQAAWRAHEATRALALLDEHRARFPRSQLRLERDGLRVLSLCELGKKAEASALAKKLIERAPRSPLRRSIEESCALK